MSGPRPHVPHPRRIVIIGGGISGLAAAHRLLELREQADRRLEVLLLESSDRLGGVMGSSYRDGFVLERGPDSFISEKPWALALSERIGLTPHLVGTNDEHRRNFVVHGGRLHPLPDGFLMMAPTRFLPLLRSSLFSWPGKLRMGCDLLLPRAPEQDDESLGAFVTRRLGREALERVVQPLVGGIYTADPDELSLAATMPRFLQMERERGSVIRSMWSQARAARTRSQRSGARWSLFVSVDRGMQGLVDALAKQLPPATIRLNCTAKALHPGVRPLSQRGQRPQGARDSRAGAHPDGNQETHEDRQLRWQIETDAATIECDAVILATPAHRSAALLAPLDAGLAEELGGIGYTSSATISLAYRRDQVPDRLDGFGFVVPRIEGRGIIACTYSSVKYPGRAPAGHVLLRAFVGGAFQEELVQRDDGELLALVRRELEQLLGIREVPLFDEIHRHWQAMPQYRVGHLVRLRRIEERLSQHPGLQLAGNGYRGVGVPDCIHSGESAAEALYQSLC